MSLPNPLPKQRFKFKGDLDFSAALNFIKNWFIEREYEYYETRYKEKPSQHGQELEIDMYGIKKMTPYIRQKITIAIHAWDMARREVVENGETKIVDNGRIIFDFIPELEFDWQDRFEETDFGRKLRTIFNEKILDKEIGMIWEDRLWYETLDFMRGLKEKLGMIGAESAYGPWG